MADKKAAPNAGWRGHAPLWITLVLFFILLAIALASQIASGQMLLPGEDAYQRLAVARSLADRFAWEIIPGEFTSAFGTLLWPVLLAPVFFLLGANVLWPWLLNVLLSVALIVLAYRAIREAVAAAWAQTVLLGLMVIALPLAPLAASGMEQVLFLALLLFFLELWARRMQSPSQAGILPLAAAAVLLASTRYEGMIVVALAALFLLLRRDFSAGLIVPIAAAVPLAVYGWISWRAGWLPVPASVYLRRAELIPSDLSQFPSVVFRSLDVLGLRSDLRAIVLLLSLLPAWMGFTGRPISTRDRTFYAPALAILAIVIHLTLIGSREFRYDAWLLLIGGWAILPALGKILPVDLCAVRKNTVTLLAGGALAILLGFPLLNRGVQGLIQFGESMEQEKWIYQLAGDWATQCGSGPLATDSPATIVFLAGKEDVVDLSGFVGRGAFQERRRGNLTADWMRMEAAASGAATAILFQPLTQIQAALVWERLGGWTQGDCSVCGSVEIFRITEIPTLSKCTNNFLIRLPPGKTMRSGGDDGLP